MGLIGPSRVRIPPPPLDSPKDLLRGGFRLPSRSIRGAGPKPERCPISRKSPCAGTPGDRKSIALLLAPLATTSLNRRERNHPIGSRAAAPALAGGRPSA